MWPFKRKKHEVNAPGPAAVRCSCCGSSRVRVITHHGGAEENYVRVWRGRRYLTCRCTDCGKDIYLEDPADVEINGLIDDDAAVDDEDALLRAEEELKRQIEENDDRRCWS